MRREPELDGWVTQFVQASIREDAVEHFVEVVDNEILASLPEMAADPVLVEDLHRSTRHQWLSFLAALRRPTHGLVLPREAADLARSLARRGMEVRVLLRVYLSAHHGVFAYLGEAVEKLAEADVGRQEALRLVWSRADRWMDESIESLIETFYEEHQREREGSKIRRAEAIESLIAGEQLTDAEATHTLGLPVTQWQTAFLVWTTDAGASSPAALHTASEAITRSFDRATRLTHQAGSRDLWCWIATPEQPTEEAIAALATACGEDVYVAVGISAPGPDGFRSSHLEARAAQQLAMAAAGERRFVDYRVVELLCLALSQRQALERMVCREIGPLCAGDKNLEPIRETVLTFLSNRMNVDVAAQRLFIHKNTVRYRLGKAEEILGRQLAERPRHIELALQYVDYFGPPAGAA